jgi:hypothetical protein
MFVGGFGKIVGRSFVLPLVADKTERLNIIDGAFPAFAQRDDVIPSQLASPYFPLLRVPVGSFVFRNAAAQAAVPRLVK